MLTSPEPDIFLAVELKLDNSVYDNGEFLPATYSASHKDRKRWRWQSVYCNERDHYSWAITWTRYGMWATLGEDPSWGSKDCRPPDSPTKCLQELEWSICLVHKETLKPYFSSEATSTLLVSIGIPSHMCQRSPRRRTANSCCRSLQTSTWTSWTTNQHRRTSLSYFSPHVLN